MDSRLDMALVFPPLWYYPEPPHELASATAWLRTAGFEVAAHDLNARALRYLLSDEALVPATERLAARYAALLADGPPRDEATWRTARDLAITLAVAPVLAPAVREAWRTFRDPARCYDLPRHRAAVGAWERAFRAVSLAHAPASIGLMRFRPAYDETDVEACVAAARDRATNPYLPFFERHAVPALLARRPRALGVLYVHPDQIVPTFTLLACLRDAGWRGPVVVFGSLEDQVSFGRYLDAPEHPGLGPLSRWVDAVALYDAEPALAGFLAAQRAGTTDAPVANLARLRDGRVVPPPRVETVVLDELPLPDYGDLDLEGYPFPEPVLTLLASRGCYWGRCRFCAITTNQPGYRTRSAARVADDLARLSARHGGRWFHFRDMLLSPAQARRICDAVQSRGLDVRWTCRARLESGFTRELLGRMREAGCVQLWVGFESADDRVLDTMDKGTTRTTAARVLDDCASVGLGVHALALHGYPGESDAEAEATVAFLEARTSQIDAVSYSDFVLFSRTPVHAETERDASRRLPLVGEQDGVLRYRFEHRSPDERRESAARYAALSQRVSAAFPVPLLHTSHVALVRDRLGAGAWRSPVRVPEPDAPLDDDRFAWAGPTGWSACSFDVEQADAPAPPFAGHGAVLVVPAERAVSVQLDGRVAPVLRRVDLLTRGELGRELAGATALAPEPARAMLDNALRVLVQCGLLAVRRSGERDAHPATERR